MDFKELIHNRRSHRKFTDEEIAPDHVQFILRAALMSPTSKGRRAWQFAVVDNKTDIEKISDAKETGSQFLNGAPLCIVVMGDPTENDCWIEDGSIAAYSMLLQAEDLGLGGCWVQMRGRGLNDGTTAQTVIHGVLDIPDNLEVLCVVGIGHKATPRQPQDEDNLKWDNVMIID